MAAAQKQDEKSLLVALRLRPLNHSELKIGARKIAHAIDSNLVVVLDPSKDLDDVLRVNRSKEQHYFFDFAFDQAATQEDVYEATTKGLVHDVLSGFNVTVFAYGPTGTGKTYTMLGTPSNPGIMVLTLNDLFYQMKSTENDVIYGVTMSYMEIYNEMIRDLLKPKKDFLELREDSSGEIIVSGLTEIEATSTVQVMDILSKGNLCRTCEPTSVNQTSSRSHAILKVMVCSKSRVTDVTQSVHTGCLFMVDLAGSERASNTKNRGKRMIEGAHINRSLLALGNVINALAQGKVPYVNFRDSKLTRILKESLGGNAKTVMIAHISPASTSYEESKNTLKYAERSRNIKTKVHQNVLEAHYHILQYQNVIAQLNHKITLLQEKLSQCQCSKKQKFGMLLQQQEKLLSEQKYLRQSISALKYYLDQNMTDIHKYHLEIIEWKLKNGYKRPDVLCSSKDITNVLDEIVTTHSKEENETLHQAIVKMSLCADNRKQLQSRKLLLEKQLTECNTQLSKFCDNFIQIPLQQQQDFYHSPIFHEAQCRATKLEETAMLNSLKLTLQKSITNDLQNQASVALNLAEKQYTLLKEHNIQLSESLHEQMHELQIKHSLLNLLVEANHHTEEKVLVPYSGHFLIGTQKQDELTTNISDSQLPKICTDSDVFGRSQWTSTSTLPFPDAESWLFHKISEPATSPRTALSPVNVTNTKSVPRTFKSLPILCPNALGAPQVNVLTKMSSFNAPQKPISQMVEETLELESINTASVASLATIKSQCHIPKLSMKSIPKKVNPGRKIDSVHTSNNKESNTPTHKPMKSQKTSSRFHNSQRRQPVRNQCVLVPRKISVGLLNSPYRNSVTTTPKKSSSFLPKVNNDKERTLTVVCSTK